MDNWLDQTFDEGKYKYHRLKELDLGSSKEQVRKKLLKDLEGDRPVRVPTSPSVRVGVEKELCPNLVALGDKVAFANDFSLYLTYRHRKSSIAGGDIEDMDLDVLLLDDSYQHRRIKPGFNVLLTDYNDPYFKDFVLPAGNLRESRRGAKRADIIVVTKCPEILTEEKKQFYISRIKPKYYQKVFFSSINYDENVINKRQQIPVQNLDYYDILLITGIANPTLVENELKRYTQRIKHLKFKDHHAFSIADIENIKKEFQKLGEYKIILTTEKDYVRLKTFDYLREKLFYWPINVEIDKAEELNQIIEDYVRKN